MKTCQPAAVWWLVAEQLANQRTKDQQHKSPAFKHFSDSICRLHRPTGTEKEQQLASMHTLMHPAGQHPRGTVLLMCVIVHNRFEATWGWALHQLGLPSSRRRHLAAVLAVPIDMTAAEVSNHNSGSTSSSIPTQP